MNTRIATLEQQTLSLFAGVFDAYSVVLFLPVQTAEGGDEECRIAAYFSLGDHVDPDCVIASGQGLVGWIMASRKPLEVPQFNQGHNALLYYGAVDEPGIKAFMGCPLPGGGVLCVDTKRQYSFNEREHKHLQMLAAILGGMHSLARDDRVLGDIPRYFATIEALEDLRRNYKGWNSYISAFLNSVADATGFDYAAFVSVEVPGESYSISAENQPVLARRGAPFYQSISSGLAGWVLRNGQPVLHSGEEGRAPALFGTSENLPDFAAVAVLPVTINKTVRACLSLGHNEAHPINETMRSFLRTAVGMLAAHGDNLYLRLRLSETMGRARVYTRGPRAHDPDTEPHHPVRTDKED